MNPILIIYNLYRVDKNYKEKKIFEINICLEY